jgi:TctA family transporter
MMSVFVSIIIGTATYFIFKHFCEYSEAVLGLITGILAVVSLFTAYVLSSESYCHCDRVMTHPYTEGIRET